MQMLFLFKNTGSLIVSYIRKLNEISEIFNGVGKAVDTGNPILPIQMPRGYGGVGILWKKTDRPSKTRLSGRV